MGGDIRQEQGVSLFECTIHLPVNTKAHIPASPSRYRADSRPEGEVRQAGKARSLEHEGRERDLDRERRERDLDHERRERARKTRKGYVRDSYGGRQWRCGMVTIAG